MEARSPKTHLITYSPDCQDTGDLEAGTKTITATSEASGVGNADYNAALTLIASPDARLEVLRRAFRLLVTIDSFDTATILYCAVYVDVQDAAHRVFNVNWNSTGAKINADVDLTSGTIFDLIGDGLAHTFYFFFWVNQANNAVISVVQFQEGVGATHVSGIGHGDSLKVTHAGFVQWVTRFMRKGTGNFSVNYQLPSGTLTLGEMVFSSAIASDHHIQLRPEMSIPHLVKTDLGIRLRDATVVTDLIYLESSTVALRSEQ